MLNSISRLLALSVAAAIAATAASSMAGAATSNLGAKRGAVSTHVVKVHGDWNDDDHDEYVRVRRGHRDHTVDAPYTHVESGRRVVVDAPFAHVYVGRHGRHVVAPFVNLWIPR